MASTFFNDMFVQLEASTASLGQGMSNITSTVMPLFAACFGAYILMVAISYWNGVSFEGMLTDMVKRFFAIAVILGLGVNISNYTSTVFPFVTDLGKGLGNAWVSGGGATSSAANQGVNLDKIIDAVSVLTDTNMDSAMKGNEPQETPNPATLPPTTPPTGTGTPTPTPPTDEGGGILSAVGDAVGGVTDALSGAMFEATIGKLGSVLVALIQNVLIWICAIIFLCVAAGYLLIAQVLIYLLAAVAPIFFAFALFPATRQYFTNWVGSVLSNSFLFLFVSVLATMFIDYTTTALDKMAQGIATAINATSSNVVGSVTGTMTNSQMMNNYDVAALSFEQVGTTCAMFILFAVILLQLPNLATSLFGGLAANGFSNLASAARNAKGMVGGKGKDGANSRSGGSMRNGGGNAKPEASGTN